ncbi:hypothetical protein M413DRAFT_111636 [Hebeloma cylindrosporum]|uniref:Uncharacterized protein n=1 Tax=Hebeloma cylindrosporum TaxID=76867 RepID=A0A0C2Z8W9_HEBCY|nr:hypothetical protein M413DRAFT_111636 [Hebeloma cylindrosporum h7]
MNQKKKLVSSDIACARSAIFFAKYIVGLRQFADKNLENPMPDPPCGENFGNSVRRKITKLDDFGIRHLT